MKLLSRTLHNLQHIESSYWLLVIVIFVLENCNYKQSDYERQFLLYHSMDSKNVLHLGNAVTVYTILFTVNGFEYCNFPLKSTCPHNRKTSPILVILYNIIVHGINTTLRNAHFVILNKINYPFTTCLKSKIDFH